jgi:predicted metalloprotease
VSNRRTLLLLVLTLLISAACSVGRSRTPSDEPAPPPGQQQTATAGDADEFERDLRGAISVAEQYWQGQFATFGQQFRPVRQVIAYRQDGEIGCGGQELTRNNAAYCPAGDFIAYDVNWAAAAFQQIGDAFLYFLLGHEYAHGIQVRLGLDARFTIEQELQADCLAGAYIGDSVRARRLELEEGDIDELRNGLIAVGDAPGQPWFAEGAHGSARQRAEAFFSGYQRSINPCGIR